MERYYNNKNELAVLVSPGYGAGWSTWSEYGYNLALDSRIIEKFMEKPDEEKMEEFLGSIGYTDVFMGGYYDLTIEWVPKGELFEITEYDGSESLKIVSSNSNIVVA